MRTCKALRSTSLYTATLVSPSSRQARMTRTAISPRLAISTLRKGQLAVEVVFIGSPFILIIFDASNRFAEDDTCKECCYRRDCRPQTARVLLLRQPSQPSVLPLRAKQFYPGVPL